jgi:hypothetical protein
VQGLVLWPIPYIYIHALQINTVIRISVKRTEISSSFANLMVSLVLCFSKPPFVDLLARNRQFRNVKKFIKFRIHGFGNVEAIRGRTH